MNKMKYSPILFSGQEVQAILEGRKTQTRRIIKPQPDPTQTGWEWAGTRPKSDRASGAVATMGADALASMGQALSRCCPFGQVGDRLWVRETHAWVDDCGWVYRATDPDWETTEGWAWRPSIHMPREASRITLEITGVRCERLCEIPTSDAISEGINGKNPFVWVVSFIRL
jgi:hypothetical protein